MGETKVSAELVLVIRERRSTCRCGLPWEFDKAQNSIAFRINAY